MVININIAIVIYQYCYCYFSNHIIDIKNNIAIVEYNALVNIVTVIVIVIIM